MPSGRAIAGSLLLLLLAGVQPAAASAGWFSAGDPLLRADLVLLNDAGVIVLPTTQWPMPRAAVEYALSNSRDFAAANAAVQLALMRVRARVQAKPSRFEVHATAGKSGLLRGFDEVARDNGEIGAAVRYSTDRFSFTGRLAVAASPADHHPIRADGSEATFQAGNWLLNANTLERYWGPNHDSALILSNNARPMPTYLIERAEARPSESPILSWLAPWRFSLGISRMESEREDIDAPLFMAWRVTVMPWRKFALGFSRTAQFCGKQLPCTRKSVFDMLVGQDNPGFNATPQSEPGNQMSGFDIRWNSPIGNLPYAVYSQMIGEDVSGYMPVKYLEQFGIEAWKPLVDGGIVQVYAECSDTACSANRSSPRYDRAYNQGKFNIEGYRYFGRVIGDTLDRDSEGASAGATFTRPNGRRSYRLNRAADFDPRDSVATVATRSLQIGWRGVVLRGQLDAEVGVQSTDTEAAGQDVKPFGYLRWKRDIAC